MMDKIFWVIWNEENRPPIVKHFSLSTVKYEAERLARDHPSQTFHVLKLIGSCRVLNTEWTYPNSDDIPF